MHYTVQINGQRISGPCLHNNSLKPTTSQEIFISRIPFDAFESELLPILELIGPIYAFRLMVNFSGFNRGFGYVQYFNEQDTKQALILLNNYEVRPKKRIQVCKSVNNCDLILGNISMHFLEQQVERFICSFSKPTKIFFCNQIDTKFAIITFISHREAALSRRNLMVNLNELGGDVWLRWFHPKLKPYI